MTTITAESTTNQPIGRLIRRTITTFLAGAIVAGGIAVGVAVATDDGAPAAPVTTHAHAAAVASEPGCLVRRGAC